MTSISKNVYIGKFNNIVTYQRTVKMIPVDVNPSMHSELNYKNNKEGHKYVRISKYKDVFAKRYVPNWSEEVFVIKKLKNSLPWTYVISDLNGEEIVGTFYKKESQYIKWKGYNNFNSSTDKKDIL